jgi:hypothetical protein
MELNILSFYSYTDISYITFALLNMVYLLRLGMVALMCSSSIYAQTSGTASSEMKVEVCHLQDSTCQITAKMGEGDEYDYRIGPIANCQGAKSDDGAYTFEADANNQQTLKVISSCSTVGDILQGTQAPQTEKNNDRTCWLYVGTLCQAAK